MVTYPSGWKTYSFDELFKICPNNTLSRDKLSNRGKIGDIHYGDILVKYGPVLSAGDEIPKILPGYEPPDKALLQTNDVVVADTAEDETVGKIVQVGEIPFPLAGGLHTIVCRPLVPTAAGYLGYYMNSREYHDQLLPYITGIKVSSISRASIRRTELHIPASIREQEAIVEAIESFDGYLSGLAALIEKKRAVRSGAVEELMGGRTRVDGFAGRWAEAPLENLCQVYDGTHQTPEYTPSGVRFVSVENIPDIYSSQKFISKQAYASNFKVYPEKGDLLMTRIGDIGTPCIVSRDEPVAYYVSLALLKHIRIDSAFLYYYIMGRDFQNELDSRTLHHATPQKINKGEIGKCVVRYPEEVAEQRAAAAVLSDMDGEISALAQEREKLLQIREGVVDGLLTGRVRIKG